MLLIFAAPHQNWLWKLMAGTMMSLNNAHTMKNVMHLWKIRVLLFSEFGRAMFVTTLMEL